MRWQFWIDRGGTFTDCLGRDPDSGEIRVAKVLSSDRAPLIGIRNILELPSGAEIPPCDIRMGTTVATNALLERKGTPCALVITKGFGDALEIGNQSRPKIFDLDIRKPAVLYSRVLEVAARADSSGQTLEAPDQTRLLSQLKDIRADGIRSVAIVTLHAYRAATLERGIGKLAQQAGFDHISLSHEVASELGLVGRGDTATIDAYLTPLIAAYVATLRAELPGSTLRVMQSSGALTEADHFRGPNAILSGPAGGVVAYARIAKAAGFPTAIGFDMGGTSTDVSRFDGTFARVYETETAGVRIRAPMMDIHTVAAGGGSLCRFDGHRLTVGPESAGADPGPLAYGRPEATELAVTDINLVLGRLQADRFPFPLDSERPHLALRRIAAQLARRGIAEESAERDARSIEELAQGFFRVANSRMAEAIRQVSVARGYDVRNDALVVFGGAGGQHACALAKLLGIETLVFHPYGGVLSAYGMGLADVGWHGEADTGRVELSDEALAHLTPEIDRLRGDGVRQLADQGFAQSAVEVRTLLDLRYRGTETALTIPLAPDTKGPTVAALRTRFEAEHERLFGYQRPEHVIEITELRVEATGQGAQTPELGGEHEDPDSKGKSAARSGTRGSAPEPLRKTTLWTESERLKDVPVFEREQLTAGHVISGPALILENTGTLVLDPEFELKCGQGGLLVARRVDRASAHAAAPSTAASDSSGAPASGASGAPGAPGAPDPVLLEIMGNLYMSVAEQMGHVLRRTALSTNIRERLDFSCAVFDRSGHLVANAPHIPVHLGAMGESVRAVLDAHPNMAPGDAYVTNDPAGGGSHLPDVTVVTPVHDANGALMFFTASRGHHADIGGITPGSMPPFSSSLIEEGVVFRGERVVHKGRFDHAAVLRALTDAPYPARNPRDNIADLEAQIAANQKGAELLHELVAQHGRDSVSVYMGHVQDNAANCVAAEIEKIPDGEHTFADALDDGSVIRVALRVTGSRMVVDFAGTAGQSDGNLNAPRAVSVAAVIYVLRALVGSSIPLNAGCLRPVEIHTPAASILCPDAGCAVAGGNVETSQRVVDVLLGALGRAAASQGTMNNLTFGNDDFGYYETIAGGAGAGPGFAGASAVHTHMTNTRITDPEMLESRFPVRLREFSIRRGSGGEGAYRGGDGVVRELEFFEAMRVSLLTERRTRRPFGLCGGEAAKPGVNSLNGIEKPGKAALEVSAGDILRIETPGGGGYGPPNGAAPQS